jgi:AraC-like DNA-binding protein
MDVERLAAQVTQSFEGQPGDVETLATPLRGLRLTRHVRATPMVASLYQPVLCLIVQGRKETTLGSEVVRSGPGDSLVISHDLPVRYRITSARPEQPYLAVLLSIELDLLRGLDAELTDTEPARSIDVGTTDPKLLDALSRYLALATEPVAQKVLAPLLLRELHFRLLLAPHGAMLRQMLRRNSGPSSIARAIALIRDDFKSPFVVPKLARDLGMSPSAFHKHFRAITSTTPLQYQKELRLLEARRLLAVRQASVTEVALEVGYESPNQFSREYARKFGVPPRDDRRNAR